MWGKEWGETKEGTKTYTENGGDVLGKMIWGIEGGVLRGSGNSTLSWIDIVRGGKGLNLRKQKKSQFGSL